MFKHYLKAAWRSIKANKFYSILNISGLAVGLATGCMLLLWVQNEFSYDRFNKEADNIYRVNYSFKTSGGDYSYGSNTPAPLKPFAQGINDIENIVRIKDCYFNKITYKSQRLSNTNNGAYYVDNGFFNMVSCHLLYGNESEPFPRENSVVLSETTAKKIFGKEDGLGKVIILDDSDLYMVSGIMKDMPENSSIARADILFPMSAFAKNFRGNGDWKTIDEDMGNFMYQIFLKLRQGTQPENIGRQLTTVFNDHEDDKSKNMTVFHLQPLKSLHLTKPDGDQSALRMVQIMMWVAILILLIASINYVNLSTARYLVRMKEVSVKKILGATRVQLFIQFMAEMLLIFLLALIAAIGLMICLMPLYNNIVGQKLSIHLSDLQFWKTLLYIILGTLAASGLYPAILLSSLKPVSTIKGIPSRNIGLSFLRKALVVVQFSISVIIIIATIVMGKQLDYIKNKDVGYDKSYVFMVNMPDDMYDHRDAVVTELKKDGSIMSVGASASNISSVGGSSGDIIVPGKPNLSLIFFETEIDKDFIPTMKLQFASGHNFTGAPSDSTTFIINETAANAIGMKGNAVGKTVTYHRRKGTIIGVLKDFNFENLKENIKPVIIGSGAWWYKCRTLYVRTTASRAQSAIAALERQYKKYVSETPFSYEFLDKSFEAQYDSEQRTGIMFTSFAAIAIFISCLGLFGLATYVAQVKAKEIGLRKVLGASVSGIVKLISKDFLKLVVIAIVIATPLAYWGMNKWLGNFAYKTSMGLGTFLVAGCIVILIAFCTIGFKAFKAARANPVRSLKIE